MDCKRDFPKLKRMTSPAKAVNQGNKEPVMSCAARATRSAVAVLIGVVFLEFVPAIHSDASGRSATGNSRAVRDVQHARHAMVKRPGSMHGSECRSVAALAHERVGEEHWAMCALDDENDRLSTAFRWSADDRISLMKLEAPPE